MTVERSWGEWRVTRRWNLGRKTNWELIARLSRVKKLDKFWITFEIKSQSCAQHELIQWASTAKFSHWNDPNTVFTTGQNLSLLITWEVRNIYWSLRHLTDTDLELSKSGENSDWTGRWSRQRRGPEEKLNWKVRWNTEPASESTPSANTQFSGMQSCRMSIKYIKYYIKIIILNNVVSFWFDNRVSLQLSVFSVVA